MAPARRCGGRTALAGLLRAANFFMMGVGATLAGYGCYLAATFTGVPLLFGSILGLGVIDFAFGALALGWCVWRRRHRGVACDECLGRLAAAAAVVTW